MEKISMESFAGIPLEEMPADNRPMSITDIPNYRQHDEVIFELNGVMAEDPVLLEFWIHTVESAKRNPKLRVKGTQITRPLEADDLNKLLEEAQERFDKGRERYWELANGAEKSGYGEYVAMDYASAEKLERI